MTTAPSLHSIFKESMAELRLHNLNSADAQRRKQLADRIYHWLRTETRKKARISSTGGEVYVFDARSARDIHKTDLPAKLDLFRIQIEKLASDVRFVTVDGKITAESAGNSKTLYHLQYGSHWFDPHPDIVRFMVKTI